jgi:hypothetical protein
MVVVRPPALMLLAVVRRCACALVLAVWALGVMVVGRGCVIAGRWRSCATRTSMRAAATRRWRRRRSATSSARKSSRWVDVESSLGDVKSSLGDAKSSLGDATSSLGDAERSLGDAKGSRWVTLRAIAG